MSQISLIYDAIHSVMTSLYPNKRELSDPAVIENNDEITLSDGYGVHFSNGSNTFRQLGCKYSVQREIIITLTKVFLGGHKSNSIYDSTNKAMWEELHTVIREFSNNNVINTVAPKRDYISDGGLERVFGENKSFLMIRCSFQFEYFEDL